jgi:hypothetical protein
MPTATRDHGLLYETTGLPPGSIGTNGDAAVDPATGVWYIKDPVLGWVIDASAAVSGGSPSFQNVTLTGLLFESAGEGLTAHAGGGQGSATPLTAEVNRVTTVATAGDSVVLMAAAAGLTIVVINHGANAMQVYGNGTDQIDDVASGTGVSQMAGSVCIYSCTVAGKWYSNGIGTGYAGSFPTVSYANALTAHAGGGQGSATPITTCIARFTTVATAADSAVLPVSSPGMQITVTNAGANSMNLFPNGTEQINALGASAAFAIAAGKTASLSCAVAGQWHSVLSA